MAILAVQQITKAGITPTFAAAAGGGDSFQFGGNEHVEVVNGGGGGINVTVPAQQACGTFGVSNTAHDIVVAVGAGARAKIKVPPVGYVDANGRVQLTYSGVTTVTVGIFS
ncbi:MAG: hypothetical protein ABI634_14035 [Acidobacteriota bacterium]